MNNSAMKVGDFRVRGEQVSRVEGFSDAAFAFAVTLLVVSLEVPKDYEGLLDIMRGVPSFAVCFALLAWLWSIHYTFFRRFGLEEPVTIALNCAFLFVIMLYVYPLKFVFTMFLGMITGLKPKSTGTCTPDQVEGLFIFYGAGFMAVFIIMALMNLRAYSLRDQLELSRAEQLLTRLEVKRCLWLASIGLLCIVVAIILPGGAAGLAGMVFSFTGVVEWIIGVKAHRIKESFAQLTTATAQTAGPPAANPVVGEPTSPSTQS
jgi:uncharacterized membrane protein